MNMETIQESIKEIIWLPTLDHTEKAERLLLLMNCAYGIGYSTGVDDAKSAVLKAIYNELGE